MHSPQPTYLAFQLRNPKAQECLRLPGTHVVGTRPRVDTTLVLSVGSFLPPTGATVERPEFAIKLTLWPHSRFALEFVSRILFRQGTHTQDSGGLRSVFPLLGELKGYRVSPTRIPVMPLATLSVQVVFAYAKSFDPIVVTALRWASQVEPSVPPQAVAVSSPHQSPRWTT